MFEMFDHLSTLGICIVALIQAVALSMSILRNKGVTAFGNPTRRRLAFLLIGMFDLGLALLAILLSDLVRAPCTYS